MALKKHYNNINVINRSIIIQMGEKIIDLKFKIPSDEIKALENAITYALGVAFKEKKVLKNAYTEENLRYTVMLAISYINHFGTYPNEEHADYHLCFQKQYPHQRIRTKQNKVTLIPDIVSLKSERKKKYSVNPLVIELKEDGKIAPKAKSQNKDLFFRIKKYGSCIESDILKTRIYINNSDDFRFKYGVVINLVSEIKPDNFVYLQEMLQRQQNEYRKEYSSKLKKNLLFAWYNTEINEPELIWLNQNEPIKLGGIEKYNKLKYS
jgi:hypothetical protein